MPKEPPQELRIPPLPGFERSEREREREERDRERESEGGRERGKDGAREEARERGRRRGEREGEGQRERTNELEAKGHLPYVPHTPLLESSNVQRIPTKVFATGSLPSVG